MTDLKRKLELARDEVARLERQLVAASCAEVGHDWVFIGGRNCGCFPGADCSVPVHQCSRCGDCDYGENARLPGSRSPRVPNRRSMPPQRLRKEWRRPERMTTRTGAGASRASIRMVP